MTRRAVLFTAIALVAAAQFPAPLWAENKGRPDLDRAMIARLSAESFDAWGRVVKLCQSAIDAGLDEDDRRFAGKLMADTLTQRAAVVCRLILDAERPDPRWPEYRRFAMDDLVRALKHDNDHMLAHFLFGRLNTLPGGDRNVALKAMDSAIRLDPNNDLVRAKALLIRANLGQEPKQRLADYNEAIQLDPQYTDAVRFRGLFHVSQQRLDDALADLDAVLRADADDAVALEYRGVVMLMQNKLPEAIRDLDKAIRLEPGAARAYVNRGRARAMLGKLEEAIADFDVAHKLDSDDLLTLVLRSRLYLQTNKTDAARRDIELILKQRPDLPEALLLRAGLLAAEGKFEAAMSDLLAIKKAEPDNGDVLRQIARLYTLQKKSRQAIEAFGEALKLDPADAQSLHGRGDAYLNIGKQAEAIADYEAALKQQPKDSGLLNNLAWVLATSPDEKLRDGRRAVELATEACTLTEYKQAHVISTLAAGYAEAGDWEQALRWSTKAVEIGSDPHKEQLAKELESYKAKKPWRELHTESARR